MEQSCIAQSTLRIGGPHDLGGDESLLSAPVDTKEHIFKVWEKNMDALLGVLRKKELMQVHELRKNIEAIDPELYAMLGYYEKWAISIAKTLLDREVITETELNKYYGPPSIDSKDPIFKKGQRVRVKSENTRTRWRKPHLRTPGYIFGQIGEIERIAGAYENPEIGAFYKTQKAPKQPLYRVRFRQNDLWLEYQGASKDSIEVEIFQHWLEPAGEADKPFSLPPAKIYPAEVTGKKDAKDTHKSSSDAKRHHHHHGDHVHEARAVVEQTAVDREGEPSSVEQLAHALVELLCTKGIVTKEEIRAQVEHRDSLGKTNAGASIVVRAWEDCEYKKRLLEDASAAVKEFGVDMGDTQLIAVENTAEIHNVIVCTLCSCYPTALLGRPPDWYKSRSYRARLPRLPRQVLEETWGTVIPESVEIRVHDSTADCRYMVLPKRPEGAEDMTQEELRGLVSRDTLVGVTVPWLPSSK